MVDTWEEWSQYILKSIEALIDGLSELEKEIRKLISDLEEKLRNESTKGDAELKTWAEQAIRDLQIDIASMKEQISALSVSQVKFEGSIREFIQAQLRDHEKDERKQDEAIQEVKTNLAVFMEKHGSALSAITAGLSLAVVVLNQAGVI